MTGEQLYAEYARAFEENCTAVDSWAELEEIDRTVWTRLAERTTPTFRHLVVGIVSADVQGTNDQNVARHWTRDTDNMVVDVIANTIMHDDDSDNDSLITQVM